MPLPLAKVLLKVDVILIVEALEFNVKEVVVVVFHAVPLPNKVHTPEPIVSVRGLELLDEKNEAVTLKLLALKVPETRDNPLPGRLRLSANVTDALPWIVI